MLSMDCCTAFVMMARFSGFSVVSPVKRHGGSSYVLAVGMRNAPAEGTFEVRDLPGNQTAEVIGEGRTIAVRDGRFHDDFAPYDVHLYRIGDR